MPSGTWEGPHWASGEATLNRDLRTTGLAVVERGPAPPGRPALLRPLPRRARPGGPAGGAESLGAGRSSNRSARPEARPGHTTSGHLRAPECLPGDGGHQVFSGFQPRVRPPAHLGSSMVLRLSTVGGGRSPGLSLVCLRFALRPPLPPHLRPLLAPSSATPCPDSSSFAFTESASKSPEQLSAKTNTGVEKPKDHGAAEWLSVPPLSSAGGQP